MSAAAAACASRTHTFRLSQILTRRQERELGRIVDPKLIESLEVLAEGRRLRVTMTETGETGSESLRHIKAFLAQHNVSFEYELPARRAA